MVDKELGHTYLSLSLILRPSFDYFLDFSLRWSLLLAGRCFYCHTILLQHAISTRRSRP